MSNKIAILGAGYVGLSAATHFALHGGKVDVYESKSNAGGLASGIKLEENQWAIEPLYHHWFLNEKSIYSLAETHKITNLIKTYSPNTSFFLNGRIKPFDRPHHVLMYPGLSLYDRYKLGLKLATLKISRNWKYYENFTAEEWLINNMGKNVYQKMWKPMLIAKWSDYYNQINMAWFWARIYVRTQKLMYPDGGFQNFNNKIVNSLKTMGVSFHFKNSVDSISSRDNNVELLINNNNRKIYDKVLITTGPKSIKSLINNIPDSYKNKINTQKSMGAICVLFFLKKNLLENTYWLNIPAKNIDFLKNEIPFLVCVDHTSMISAKHYNDNRILYCANYINENSEIFDINDEDIINIYIKGLKKINPDFKDKNILKTVVSRTKYASPVFMKNHSNNLPKFDTFLDNVYWASMSHIYPWDRGTNYAADIGFKVAKHILKK